MSKPASGTALDTGSAFYTNLTAAWGLLEGSGSTSADSKGSRTLTLGTGATWGSDAEGPYIDLAGTSNAPLALATALGLSTAGGWTIAFKAKTTTNGDNGMVMGDSSNTTDFVWMRGGSKFGVRNHSNLDMNFTDLTSFTTEQVYVVTADTTSPDPQVRVYAAGTASSLNPIDSGGDAALNITTLGNGYTGTSFPFIGRIRMAAAWSARVLSGAEASTFASNPYVLWSSVPAATAYTLSGPSFGYVSTASGNFTVTPNGAYTGTITPHSTGSGSFSPSSLTWSADSSAKTFTYTPSSTTGSPHAVSTTASPTLGTNPSAVNYTVAAAPTAIDLTDSSIYGHYAQIEGGVTLTTNVGVLSWVPLYNNGSTGGANEGAVRFRGTITSIDLHAYLNGSVVRLSVDGVDTASATLSNTSAWGNTLGLFTGLDGAADHEYLLSWGGVMFVDQLRLSGGTGINTAALAARPVIAAYGDSITLAVSNTGGDSTLGYTHRLGLGLHYQVANRGIGSTYVHDSGGGFDASVRTVDITGLSPAPSVVLVLYGVNDCIAGTSLSTFQTAYTAMLTALRAGLPSALIVCEAILKRSTSGDTDQDAYNARIALAVAGKADAKIVYKTGGYANYNPSTGGGLHPDGPGYQSFTPAMLLDIGYSTGTLSGTLGAVTLSAAATSVAPPPSAATLAATLGSVTLTGSGTNVAPSSATGTLAKPLGDVTLSATATAGAAGTTTGTLSATLAGVSLVASATASTAGTVTGSLQSTLGAFTLTGTVVVGAGSTDATLRFSDFVPRALPL